MTSNVPKELDLISDVVLRYRPPEKVKAGTDYVMIGNALMPKVTWPATDTVACGKYNYLPGR